MITYTFEVLNSIGMKHARLLRSDVKRYVNPLKLYSFDEITNYLLEDYCSSSLSHFQLGFISVFGDTNKNETYMTKT